MIDEIDFLIIDILQQDARSPLSYISKQINLSIPAISERIKKLEGKGYIKKYTTILDNEKFLKNLTCFCFITLNYNQKNLDLFKKIIDEENDIVECHCITGEYEYLLKIITKNTSTLEELLTKIRREASVLNSSTVISLSDYKNLITFKASKELFNE